MFGGSQGAQRINDAVSQAAPDLAEIGIGVLHAYGRRNEITVPEPTPGSPPYVAVPYLDRMDLAYAAADLVLARSGAMTVAEIAAVGLPAVYVPLPHGNGEQRLNASAQVASGAAIIIEDAALDRRSGGRTGRAAGHRRDRPGRDDGRRGVHRVPPGRRGAGDGWCWTPRPRRSARAVAVGG